MLRCSSCRAGGTVLNALNKKCSNCPAILGHVCDYCRRRSLGGVLNISCSGCRPHVCLSKCSRGCIKKEARVAPTCRCPTGPIRLAVKKEGKNHGRFFWSCRPCDFFAWDWALNKKIGSILPTCSFCGQKESEDSISILCFSFTVSLSRFKINFI